jgi:hypothetical protein
MTASDTKRSPARESVSPPAGDPPVDIAAAEAAPDQPEGAKSWESAIVLVRGSVPEGARRPVVVVQTTERQKAEPVMEGGKEVTAAPGTHRNGGVAPLKNRTYPAGADVYFRVDPDADFGADRVPVVGVGVGLQVEQAGFEGFADRLGFIHVGPNSAIYAAVNYAYTRGAKRVEVVGLNEAEQKMLAPWFAGVAEKVEITYG